MSQADYPVDEVGTYGLRAQPAVVARMRPQLRSTAIGSVAAIVAVVCAILTAFWYARWTDLAVTATVVVVAAAVLMLVICALQAWLWREAMAEWSGKKDVSLALFLRPSWVAHLLSYPVALLGVLACGWIAADAGPGQPTCWSAIVAAIGMIVAQLTAAVEYLRLEGPPGALPMHFRRLIRIKNPDSVRRPQPDSDDPAASILRRGE